MYSKKHIAFVILQIIVLLAVCIGLIWYISTSISAAYGYKGHQKPHNPSPTIECTPTPTGIPYSPTPDITPTPSPTVSPTAGASATPTPLVCQDDDFPSCTVNWEFENVDCVCKKQSDAFFPSYAPNTGRAL